MASFVKGLGELLVAMEAYEIAAHRSLQEGMTEIAALLESEAQSVHPWMDESGDTRRNTTAEVSDITLEEIVVKLQSIYEGRSPGSSGGAGMWLELARGGQWAWLMDTVFANSERIMEILERRGVSPDFFVDMKADFGQHDWTESGGD